MVRGKSQIKSIENMSIRQITYTTRRIRLVKKAHELSVLCVLCDARVSLIVVSSSGKIHEFSGQSTTTKQLLDLYQKTAKIDLWSSQFERMQEKLRNLKEDNRRIQTQIRQRMGQCLDGLSFEELYNLEQEMENAARLIRERKFKTISNQMDLTQKKLNRARQEHNAFLADVAADDPIYGVVDNGGVYDYRVHHINALIQLPNQPNHEGQTDSCLTSNSSASPQNLDGKTESVCTPCSSLNPPDSATSGDIQI